MENEEPTPDTTQDYSAENTSPGILTQPETSNQETDTSTSKTEQPTETTNQPKSEASGPNFNNPNKHASIGQQLSKTPVLVFSGCLILLISIIAWGYLAPKGALSFGDSASADKKPEPGKAAAIIASAPNTVSINAASTALPTEEPTIPNPNGNPNNGLVNHPAGMTPNTMQGIESQSAAPSIDYRQQERMQVEMQRQQEAAQREAARQAKLQAAKEAPSTIFSAYQNSPHHADTPASGQDTGIQQAFNGDQNSLQGRISSNNTSSYLPHTRMPALSPYEIKAGTVIPSVMLSGINSDLPGELIAQVVQNVYDSATGKYLLVPQGAKLVGTYDHGIIVGQQRVLIIWNRIIYPDSSSIDIQAMAGQDQSGYAGFHDKVNSHVWPAVRQALLLSAISAGAQLSQARAQKGDYSYSSQQIGASALGQQLNQLGMSSYQSRANMTPTIVIRPGYRFNVMVNKDMVIPPWQQNAAVPPISIYTAFGK